MNNLDDFIKSPNIRRYFSSLTEEEIESRLLIYLEIFPWLIYDLVEVFRNEENIEAKAQKYRNLLVELRDKKEQVEIDV